MKLNKDILGTRMKDQYENRTRFSIPRRTYTIMRLDGKAFHTYTRGLKRPFDEDLIQDMDDSIIKLLPNIQGAVFAYTQSDEISILLTDFATPNTDAWFDGNLQKMCSVSASIITAEFNKLRWDRYLKTNSINLLSSENKTAYFDSRVFTIPDRIEVMNYFIWRNQDCSRNSVSMVAQSHFSHKQLQGKSTKDMHEMLHLEGINWAIDFPDGHKNGRLIVKETYYSDKIPYSTPKEGYLGQTMPCERTKWVSKGAGKFTEDKDKLLQMIPKYE